MEFISAVDARQRKIPRIHKFAEICDFPLESRSPQSRTDGIVIAGRYYVRRRQCLSAERNATYAASAVAGRNASVYRFTINKVAEFPKADDTPPAASCAVALINVARARKLSRRLRMRPRSAARMTRGGLGRAG